MNVKAYRESLVYVLCGMFFVFLVAPTVRAEETLPFFFPKVEGGEERKTVSLTTTKKAVTYQSVLLSDLDSTVTGDIGSAKISLPKSVIADGTGESVISEVKGRIITDVLDENEMWLDSKKNFMVYDTNGEVARAEIVLKDYGIQKSKKGVFQGDKNSPTLIASGVVADVDVDSNPALGSKIELYTMFVYDPSVQRTVSISFLAPKSSSKTNQKIWQTFLKSVEAKKKSSDTSKKSDSSMTKSTTYKNTHFSIKLPQGWKIDRETESEIVIVTPNLGASVGVGIAQVDDVTNYDPDLRSFWVSIFIDEYKKRFEDFVFIDAKDVTVGGLPGLRIEYTATIEGMPIEGYQLVTVKKGKTYILTATVVDKSQWKKYGSAIEKSFATFKRR